MKNWNTVLTTALALMAMLIIACDDADSNTDTAAGTGNLTTTDNDTSSTSDSATVIDTDSATANSTDTASDTASASDSGTTISLCGGEGEACCDTDGCTEGLDAYVIESMAMCLCVAPCTFTACTAGTEPGYCAPLYQVEGLGCVNTTDFPDDRTSNDCTPGEACTTDSGDVNGICKELPDPLVADATFIRCVAACDTPPSACATEGLVCTPNAIAREDGTYEIDYANAHCFPPM